MLNIKKESVNFTKLAKKEKLVKIKKWVATLAEQYDYFRDLQSYITANSTELDEDFLDAMFQIILNLAKEIEKA